MNIKLADIFWILMNKADVIVIYIDDKDGPTPEYYIINKDTDINSIIDYMTMNIKYMGREHNFDGSLIFRVILTTEEI